MNEVVLDHPDERQRAQEALEERVRFETLLFDLSARFASLPAREINGEVVQGLRRLVEFLGVDRGVLFEFTADACALRPTQSYAAPGVVPAPDLVPAEQCPWYAARLRRGATVRLPEDLPAEAGEPPAFLGPGLQSHLAIPLAVGGSVIGALGFATFQRRRAWPEELVPRLRLVGEVFANALQRQRAEEALRASEESLRQSQRELRVLAGRLLRAQEAERRRIARELHDDLSQSLALLAVELELLGLKPPGSAGQLAERVQGLVARAREVSSDVHRLSHRLHPSKLEQLGLVAALAGLCKELEHAHGLRIGFTAHAVPPVIPEETALCLYRIAQEALRNVVKHSAARGAGVGLTAGAGALCLSVADTGAGFDPAAAARRGGLGLVSMRERLRLVGGTLDLQSRPGHGTRLDVRVPLPADGPAPTQTSGTSQVGHEPLTGRLS
jgi:signal transduction histidine kinase